MSACGKFRNKGQAPLMVCEDCGYYEAQHPAGLTIEEVSALNRDIKNLGEQVRYERDLRRRTAAALKAALDDD